MSSQKKIDSARTNGAKSHGPKTEEGRKISSQNAVKHGLYSSSVVLTTESREEYQALLDAYIQQFQPEGQVELHLVEEMVAAKWRQRRLWAIESDILEDEMIETKAELEDNGGGYTPITPLSRAYTNLAQRPALQLLVRHEARLERAYSRAFKNLQELQRARKVEPPPPQKVTERTQPPVAPPFLQPTTHSPQPDPKRETIDTPT